MKKIAAYIACALCLWACGGAADSNESSPVSESAIQAAISGTEAQDRALLERGVRQAAFLWRAADGTEEEFCDLVRSSFKGTPEGKKELFDKLSSAYAAINGMYGELGTVLQRPVILKGPAPDDVDFILSMYSPYSHLSDDMFANRLAFITVLNFPNYTLAEKNELGKNWSRLEWAYARMGDQFTTRVPARIGQDSGEAGSRAESYIADYNIMMGHLLTESGERLFPEDMVLLSHWNLRDEIKSNYADVPHAREKQEMIYKVMEHIVLQDIPGEVVNNAAYDWAPYSNRTWKDGQELTLAPEGAERYARILDIFHTMLQADPYCPQQPDAIIRNFEGGMEVSADEIESLFVKLLSSDQVKRTGDLIRKRLGRDLRPYDIWYDGFKSRSAMPEDRLSEQTRALYPDPEAFEKGMPKMLQNLGFSKSYAEYLAEKIGVEAARGSGHALGSPGKGYKSYLRTRVADIGMDYKGYNIAVHEFGHNVEQTIDMYDIDYYTLNGVPNTAFTEALAFIFQKRDLKLLGYDTKIDDNVTLDIFWGMYEIMGVSLVDMYTWRWLYAHRDATPEDLRDNCLRIAREVWNMYFEPVLGTHDSPILAIYSHMVNSPMYLPNYPFGHIVEYQLEEHFSRLPDPDVLGPEIERIWKIGRLTPQAWMNEAVGSDVSIDPILKAVDRILAAS